MNNANNHSLACYLQLASFARFTGDQALAQACRERAVALHASAAADEAIVQANPDDFFTEYARSDAHRARTQAGLFETQALRYQTSAQRALAEAERAEAEADTAVAKGERAATVVE